jgi:hypothetical protein
MRKTLFISASVAALVLVAAGGAAMAAGGFGAPGTTKFRDVDAGASVYDSAGTQLFISVDRGIQTFKLRGVSGPPVMVGPETVLNWSGFTAEGSFVGGCVVIPDSAFVVAGNLSSATLKVDPSMETQCAGFHVPAGAGGRPGLSSIVPNAGGGGGGGGATITANLTWTSNGAVMESTFVSSSKCQGALAHTVGSSSSTFSSVAGSVSALVDISTIIASISQFDDTETITNTFSDACVGA